MEEKSTFVHLKNKVIELVYTDFENEIDVDNLTSIDYSNLYGEAVTIPALVNKVGLLKTEAESLLNESKLDINIYEANLKNNLRKEAARNSGKVLISNEPEEWLKLTEKALEELIFLNKDWQDKKKDLITKEKNLGFIESLMWSVQSKDRKLNNLLPQIIPTEFEEEIVEGKINGMLIKKHNKKYSK